MSWAGINNTEPDGRFPFFTSNRVATDRSPERSLDFDALLERIRAPGNGLRDVHRIAIESLDLGPACGE